jgi:hypothetical protein
MDLKQQQVEFVKCARNCLYFLLTYGKVRHPLKGLIPFKMYDFQETTLSDFLIHRFTIILKSRQLGLSTLVAGYCAWLMIFHPNKEILVIATKQSTAINFITKVKVFLRHLPAFLQPKLTSDNQQSVTIANGSTCTASPSSDDAGRSEALSLLVLDEAAFIKNIDILWTAAYPTLSTGGDAIILSTPNGQGNFFHKMFTEATSELNDFKPITLNWDLHPERDQQWWEDAFKALGFDKQKMAQEYECSFIASGNTVVEAEALQWYRKHKMKDPIKKFGPKNAIWNWRDISSFSEDTQFVITADVARGDGKDFSTYEVFDLVNYEQIEEFKGKVATTEFVQLLLRAATTYNKAQIVVENNGLGWAVASSLVEQGYSNLYYTSRAQKTKVNPYAPVEAEVKMVPGFTMSPLIRPRVIDALVEVMNPREMQIYSQRLFDELDVFIWYNGKAQAMSGYNDDLVMPLAMASYLKYETLRNSHQPFNSDYYTPEFQTFAEVLEPQFSPVLDDPWEDPELGDLRWLIND